MSPEEIERHKDMELAEAHNRLNEVTHFMDDLSPMQLGSFIKILYSIVDSNAGALYIHNLLGQATTVQRLKNKRCACGEDHDAKVIENEKTKLELERSLENDEPAMKEYNLIRREDGSLVCRGCGMGYVSLDDRMLRRPGVDGCSGCQQKSAFG